MELGCFIPNLEEWPAVFARILPSTCQDSLIVASYLRIFPLFPIVEDSNLNLVVVSAFSLQVCLLPCSSFLFCQDDPVSHPKMDDSECASMSSKSGCFVQSHFGWLGIFQTSVHQDETRASL